MLGTAGQWLYQGLAGITLDDSARAWSSFTVNPAVGSLESPAQRAIVGYDATHNSVRGDIKVTTRMLVLLNGSLCSAVREGSEAAGQLPNLVSLDCGTQTIGGIDFASYGSPVGDCSTGFTRNPSCDAANSASIVAKLCVGKHTCAIPVNNTEFGGDPCGGHTKQLAVVAHCSGGCRPVFELNVTVPAGTTASARIPLPVATGAARPTAGAVLVSEGGVPLFANGSYTPNVAGVTGAVFDGTEGVSRVVVTLGGGTYSFIASLCA